MKKKPLILILLVLAAGLVIFFTTRRETTHPGDIKVSGNIEVTDAALSFRIPGQLTQCLVDEGDTVTRGAVLARLDDADQKIAVNLAQNNLARAESILAELRAGSRPEEIELAGARVLQARQALLELTRGSRTQEIQAAQADLDTALAAEKSAKSQFAQAREDFDRFSVLLKENSVSRRDFEIYRTRYEVAQNAVDEAASRVRAARQALSLKKEGPRSEQIERAGAALAQAEAEYALIQAGPRQEKIDQAVIQAAEAEERLRQARQQLAYTELTAPMDGVVLSRSAEPGEFLNPSTPVLTLGDLSRPWLRAYVNEKDLGRIRLKDKARVSTDSFPDKSYEGEISYISSQAEFTPKSVQTFEERVKLMYRIKIALADPDHELKPGMPADALIHPALP